ncbi:hypothetical protein B0E37_01689 [Streptomyces sp. MH192]|nr:hypothetical protein [Streptomyces sp. MH192]MCF0098786.1 hypothetical protein [Streptomyces sp. MH191]
MTPAEELRTAADKLRCAAELAGGQTWTADVYPEGTIVRATASTLSLFRLAADGRRAAGTPNVAAPVGEYMATVDPTVGIAFADWLDTAATNAVVLTWPNDFIERALAVARAINGGQE